MKEDDQWKSAGDCTKCRRQKYCKTGCKAHREALMAELTVALIKRTLLHSMPKETNDGR